MYVNRDSTKVFERQHAKDRMAQLAHHLAEDPSDGDIFLSHARAESRGGWVSIGLISMAVVVVLVCAVAFGLSS
jgi:hypothetical protein